MGIHQGHVEQSKLLPYSDQMGKRGRRDFPSDSERDGSLVVGSKEEQSHKNDVRENESVNQVGLA